MKKGASVDAALNSARRLHQARCDAAMERYRATGISHSTEDVLASLQARLDARREQLRGRRRPTTR